MPSLWRDLFTVSRPSSRNRSRSRTISSTVNGVDSTDQEHFVLVKPYSRADDYTKASSRVRSYSNPPKPQPIHIRAPSQPEMIHVLPPANAASDAATHRKSVDNRVPRNASHDSSSHSNSASSFNGHHPGQQQGRNDIYRSHAPRHRSMSVAPRPESVGLHDVFAVSRRHHTAALTYDVLLTPSIHSVFDCVTGRPMVHSTLQEPATYPSISCCMTLHSELLPWPINVHPVQSKSVPRFYIPSSRSDAGGPTHHPVTILDVLWSVHNTLNIAATQQEWDALGHGSKNQKRITRAYDDRCQKMNGGWEAGVKRCDWLGSRILLAGVDVVQNGSKNEYHLLFTRPH